MNLRATACNYQPSTFSTSNEPRNILATSAPYIQYHNPSLKLSLEKFDGDILKYHTFKRKSKSCIEAVYQDFNIRMSFLEETCVGKAREVISGLSCFDDRRHAYDLSWERLDKRFGDQRKLMSLVKQDLVNGPPIKEWDANGLRHLCDLMYKCETSFKAWNKSHLLDNDEIMLGLFQRLPNRVRAKFVLVSNEGNDGGTFQELRELVELAASEFESVYGKVKTQNKSKSHQLGRPKSLCAAIQRPSKPTPTIQYAQSCVLCESVHKFENALYFLNNLPKIEN